MKALLLCAGQGTRLKKLTETRPKPMLPIAGRPLLAHLVDWLLHFGISEIAINLHHCPDTIIEYFGTGRRRGLSITYSYEYQLLGTAGAAKQLESFLDERFVVAYGDVLTNLNLTRLLSCHEAHPNGRDMDPATTLALYRVSDPTQCSTVELDANGLITRFLEKPAADQVFSDLAFSGIMVCEPSILNYVPPDVAFDFGHDLLPILLEMGEPVRGIEIAPDEYVVDIGSLPGYLRALRVFSTQFIRYREQPTARRMKPVADRRVQTP